jgi:hypothetical protein
VNVPAIAMLVTLLLLDAVFVLLQVGRVLALETSEGYAGMLANPRFSLEFDRGYSEWFGYAKAIATSGVLMLLYRRRRGPAYLAWSLVFVTIMVDDAFMVHEQVGGRLVTLLDLRPGLGLRSQDFGELLVWGTMALVLLAILSLAHRVSSAGVRSDSRRLFLLLAALVFFGVGMDMAHILVSGWLDHALAILEDGGELVVLSMIICSVLEMARQHHARETRQPEPARATVP